jgi:hypothetical protein
VVIVAGRGFALASQAALYGVGGQQVECDAAQNGEVASGGAFVHAAVALAVLRRKRSCILYLEASQLTDAAHCAGCLRLCAAIITQIRPSLHDLTYGKFRA